MAQAAGQAGGDHLVVFSGIRSVDSLDTDDGTGLDQCASRRRISKCRILRIQVIADHHRHDISGYPGQVHLCAQHYRADRIHVIQ